MIELLLDALAAYRVTKLVVDDQLTAEPRDAVIRWAYRNSPPKGWDPPLEEVGDQLDPGGWVDVVAEDDDPPKLAFLVTCPWCAGMWVSLGVVALDAVAPRPWRHLRRALAMSAAAGLIAENLQH